MRRGIRVQLAKKQAEIAEKVKKAAKAEGDPKIAHIGGVATPVKKTPKPSEVKDINPFPE